MSPKNGFCIDDSYIYDSTVVHAGTFVGSKGSCADPTTLRGLTVGGADEYDYRDPGQAIPFDGVPDGTYWFRAMSDPNNDFVEANEANNETDVKVTIAGGTVTAGQVTSSRHDPAADHVGRADRRRDASAATSRCRPTRRQRRRRRSSSSSTATSSGSAQTSSPYTLSWDTTTVVDGEHWVAARTTDAQGRTNTSRRRGA